MAIKKKASTKPPLSKRMSTIRPALRAAPPKQLDVNDKNDMVQLIVTLGTFLHKDLGLCLHDSIYALTMTAAFIDDLQSEDSGVLLMPYAVLCTSAGPNAKYVPHAMFEVTEVDAQLAERERGARKRSQT